MVFMWIALVAVFSVIESLTMQLLCIWFAGGAFAAAVAGLLGANVTVQIVVFFAVSIVLLLTTRPLVKRYIKTNSQKTNTDSLIGREIELTETVDNIKETGKAIINGVSWSVRNMEQKKIDAGSICTVEKIEGVKLIVAEKRKD